MWHFTCESGLAELPTFADDIFFGSSAFCTSYLAMIFLAAEDSTASWQEGDSFAGTPGCLNGNRVSQRHPINRSYPSTTASSTSERNLSAALAQGNLSMERAGHLSF